MGSLVSYLYYKNSVAPSCTDEAVVRTNVVITEPIPIRHRPTTYEPDLQIDLVPENFEKN